MKHLIQLRLIILYLIAPGILYASTITVSDTISTAVVWDMDTVKITGNLVLAEEGNLTILPGTRVEFQGNYSFIIKGEIHAKGAVNDSILFTINDTTGFSDFDSPLGGWKKIDCYDEQHSIDDSSGFKYCIFEYGKNMEPEGKVIFRGGSSIFLHNQIRKCYAQYIVLESSTMYGSGISSVILVIIIVQV